MRKQQYKHIKLSQMFFMAWRDLTTKRFRSLLTIAGVTIGVGAVFFLLSFGIGLQEVVERQIIGNSAINTIDVESPNGETLPLNREVYQRVKDISGISDVVGLNAYAGSLEVENATADTVIYGVDASYARLSNLDIRAGSFFAASGGRDVVVDASLLQAIGFDNPRDAIGKSVKVGVDIEGKPRAGEFVIKGVSEAGTGSELFLPQWVFESFGVDTFTQLKVHVDNRESIPEARKTIESFGFKTSSPIDMLEQINQVFRFFKIVLVGFGSIGLIIAILGMLNTLTVSLLERTQEIALMVTLGARVQDMRRLFIVQGVMLALIGGIVGMILAALLGNVVNAILNQLAAGRGVTESFSIFAMPLPLIGGTILFSCLVGYVVALLPARRAARINPIEALRHE